MVAEHPSRVRPVVPRLLLFAALLMGLVGCDHASKRLAASTLEGRPPMTLIRGAMSLRYVENRDSAFSLLGQLTPEVRRGLLVTASLLTTAFLATLWWQRRRAALPTHLAFALLLAGGIGNLVDRAFRGYVVDFVHVRYWPVFNLADAYLVVGTALLLLSARGATASARPSSAC